MAADLGQNGATADHAVVIVGGGPTGMMLAGELALAGVDVAIVERRDSPDLAGSRGGGLHARTIEILDQRGIADRFVSAGQKAQVAGFNMVRLDISDFPTRHNYGLALFQNHIERILADWLGELPVTFIRGREVTGFVQDADGVAIALSDRGSMRGRYLVGCDGGRSLIRKEAGIAFPGWDPTMSWTIAEVETTEPPKWGGHVDAEGVSHGIGPVEGTTRARIVLTEPEPQDGEPTLDEVRAALRRIYGTDFGIHSPVWISRFTDMTRQAAAYRDRRVLIAGDAAHVHPPIGGQGLNIGIHDAVNLGWKLAEVVKGQAPDSLLDTYQAERHEVTARVLRTTMAQAALRRTDSRTKALGDTMADLLAVDGARKQLAGELSGLSIRYDLGGDHPLVGRRMPDLDIDTTTGTVRVYALLHEARPLLLDFGATGSLDLGHWAGRVRAIGAQYEGRWDLPVIGTVEAPAAVLVRPDGHVAWVGDGTDAGLAVALAKWFGPAAP